LTAGHPTESELNMIRDRFEILKGSRGVDIKVKSDETNKSSVLHNLVREKRLFH